MICFYTQAYNAEKTIERTIKSVLAQTYTNWIWYLVDNGATDKTGDIIKRYAELDNRIKPDYRENNKPGVMFDIVPTIAQNYAENDFFATLDADDEYAPDFIEKMLTFAQRNRLEITACGSDFIDAKTKKITGVRLLPENLLIEGDGFSKHFPLYHQFMRTIWCKLYSISILKKVNWENLLSIYGADTLFCIECFRSASRIGILSKSLHKYYMSVASVSYRFDPKRIESDYILHKTTLDFLIEKCGSVSSHNESFLMLVYMKALRDTLSVLLNARIPTREKLVGIIDMFAHEYAGQLMAREHLGLGFGSVSEASAQRRELFLVAAGWLLSLDEVPNHLIERYCDVGERLSAATEDAGKWLFFQKLRLRFLLEENRRDEARLRLSELIELIPNDPEMAEFQRLL